MQPSGNGSAPDFRHPPLCRKTKEQYLPQIIPGRAVTLTMTLQDAIHGFYAEGDEALEAANVRGGA